MKRFALTAATAATAAVFAPSTSAPAQTVQAELIVVEEGQVISSPGAPATAAGAAGTAATTADGKPKEQPLLEALRKTPLTRPPQAVLDATAEAARPPVEPPKSDKTPAPTEQEKMLKALQQNVALGRWREVGKFLTEQFKDKPDDAKQAYAYLLDSLSGDPRRGGQPSPQMQMMMNNGGNAAAFRETNLIHPADVVELADISPGELDQPLFDKLGALLRTALDRGERIEALLGDLDRGAGRLGGSDPGRRTAAAKLLFAAGREIEAGAFLPTPEQALDGKSWEQATLVARHFTAKHAEEGKPEWLEKAWHVVQGTLALPNLEPAQRADALARAMNLAPRVPAELGGKWLLESFSNDPARGLEILAAIGNAVSKDRMNFSAQVRESNLELQSRVVTTLLEHAPERASEWREPLTVLALNWLTEAKWSLVKDRSTQRGPMMQYDSFGNVYFMSDDGMMQQQMMGNQREPAAIASGRLLDLRPDTAWLDRVQPTLRPALTAHVAELFLKVNEPEAAFPLIESTAATLKDEGKRLADRFLDVWTEKHDPNAAKRRTNRFMYIYGYNPQAEGIPLTRSQQERNLEELAGWVKRLRALPIEPVEEAKIADAFVKTHSTAEVYKLEAIEKVFGGLGTMKADTLASLVQTMRQNLASVWRSPKVQQDAKTKRTDKEILAQVIRGYQVALEALEEGLQASPDHWGLQLAHAAVSFDSAVHETTYNPGSGFAPKRDAAFAEFQKAAKSYLAAVPTLKETEQTAQPLLQWFYASLGAVDLEAIKFEYADTPKQWPVLKEALFSLTGEAGRKLQTEFANALSTRMSAVQPELKHRYLGAGLQIVGDHERARDAKQLWDYYQDLVTEIQLVAHIDGSDKLKAGEPFGLFVDIRHTKQIEREAGGFQKYLQNQRNGYYYNFGRPPENYREKFEEAARQALQETFDVVSCTFHADKIESRGTDDADWRITPYAYFLLKPKGPQVDAVPPLKLSLDFLDTSGFAILPIESAKLPVDCTGAGDARPVTQVEIKQILDERKAKEGVLALEIRATAHGIVPALDTLLEVKPKDFEVVETEDQGAQVVQLDPETDEPSAVSERLWNLTFKVKPGLSRVPETFQFATPKNAEHKVTWFRYADADLAEVPTGEASLTERYEAPRGFWGTLGAWFPWVAGIGLIGAGAFFAWRQQKQTAPAAPTRFPVPDDLTPLNVLGLLRAIKDRAGLPVADASELAGEISRLEAHYYAADGVASPDLAATARQWSARAG